jgi:hypothetical protein
MAIRPVDLQLAYMAAPQNAAVAANAANGPQGASQATAAAFAAAVREREETVAAATKSDRDHAVRPRTQSEREGGQPRKRRDAPGDAEASADPGPAMSGDGEHLIDFTA